MYEAIHYLECVDEKDWKTISSSRKEALALIDSRNLYFMNVDTTNVIRVIFGEEDIYFDVVRGKSYDEMSLTDIYTEQDLSRGYELGAALDAPWRREMGFIEEDHIPKFVIFELSRIV